jgi:mRNA interferase MazF
VTAQGEVWWADLAEPSGSEPGFRRPVVVVQGEAFNRSRIATVVCVALTSDLRWANAPGNVLLTARATGLPKDSVANVSQLVTLDREALTERAGARQQGVQPDSLGSQVSRDACVRSTHCPYATLA